MLPTRIFQESPFKALKILAIILVPIFLLFAIMSFSDETPRMTNNGLNKSALLLVIMSGVFGVTFLITFLTLSFQTRKTLKCDFEKCEIMERNFWTDVSFCNEFRWDELKDTNIIEKEFSTSDGIISIYTFTAETKDKQHDLLDLKTSSKKNIEGLINYVNKAAPHLKYIWVKDVNVGSRLAVDSIYGYSKVGKD